jgi:hypothetical protein
LAIGVVTKERLPDAHDVAEHAHRHQRIGGALVLDEDEDEGFATVDLGGEHEIGVAPLGGCVDVRRVGERQ